MLFIYEQSLLSKRTYDKFLLVEFRMLWEAIRGFCFSFVLIELHRVVDHLILSNCKFDFMFAFLYHIIEKNIDIEWSGLSDVYPDSVLVW